VRNPLENEDSAFRFVLTTIAYLAPIVVAARISTRLGVVVFVVATGVVVYLIRRSLSGRRAAPVGDPARADVEDTHRILVVANETLLGARLHEVVLRLAEDVPEDVYVVCPVSAPSSEEAVDAASERLVGALHELRQAGVSARGETCTADPLQALEQALERFSADEVVISTYEEGWSPWLEEGVVDAVRARFEGPVTHVTEARS
jgi:hypothetical protein